MAKKIVSKNGRWFLAVKSGNGKWVPVSRPWLSESEARNRLAAGL